MIIVSVAVVGIILCLYGFAIEQKVGKDKRYKPVCDLSAGISCSKAIKSKYGKFFGVSNTLVGMVYYLTIVFLQYFNLSALTFYLTLFGACASIVLAFILYVRIKTLCLLCTTAYVINFVLLYVSCQQYWG
ncbi:MAG TPA: vitamin K epoxide reductase family protein [Candidatus Babeliales bacterium]|nr:vitamin K epoxide reductase family protein [Candidatus Babeliales bacterium]